jgi:hypothetical protein
MAQTAKQTLVIYYLIATPVFILIEWSMDFAPRTAFSDDTTIKTIYYLFLFACGFICWWSGQLSGLVGIIESSISITLLIISFVKPVILPDIDALEAGTYEPAVNVQAVLNFLIAGSILIYSFHSNLHKLQSRH